MSKINDVLFSMTTKAILVNVFARLEGIHLPALMSFTRLGAGKIVVISDIE